MAEKPQEKMVLSRQAYEDSMQFYREEAEHFKKGRRVIKGKAIPWQQDRQGIRRTYTHRLIKDLAMDTMTMFTHEIRTHSGRHVHQGGLAIFVLEGKGYSVVDGVRHDWQAGDLIMLPIKGGGVEHQHFNLDKAPSRWLALIPHPLQHFVGQMLEQKEDSPTWKEH